MTSTTTMLYLMMLWRAGGRGRCSIWLVSPSRGASPDLIRPVDQTQPNPTYIKCRFMATNGIAMRICATEWKRIRKYNYDECIFCLSNPLLCAPYNLVAFVRLAADSCQDHSMSWRSYQMTMTVQSVCCFCWNWPPKEERIFLQGRPKEEGVSRQGAKFQFIQRFSHFHRDLENFVHWAAVGIRLSSCYRFILQINSSFIANVIRCWTLHFNQFFMDSCNIGESCLLLAQFTLWILDVVNDLWDIHEQGYYAKFPLPQSFRCYLYMFPSFSSCPRD